MFELPCCIYSLIQLVFLAVVVLFLCVCIVVRLASKPYADIKVFQQEHYFRTSKASSDREKFKSLEDPGSLDLSVIIPAYNEEERLPKMLDECLAFLSSRPSSSFEVIIVDDGSKDATTATALEYVERHGSDIVRVLTLAKNRGKGGAVRMGMLRAR